MISDVYHPLQYQMRLSGVIRSITGSTKENIETRQAYGVLFTLTSGKTVFKPLFKILQTLGAWLGTHPGTPRKSVSRICANSRRFEWHRKEFQRLYTQAFRPHPSQIVCWP